MTIEGILSNRPKIIIPNLKPGNLRAFEMCGDSMTPLLKDGDVVIGRKVEDMDKLIDNTVYVIATYNGLFIKRVLLIDDYMGRLKTLVASNENREYANFTININDVIGIWKVERRISKIE